MRRRSPLRLRRLRRVHSEQFQTLLDFGFLQSGQIRHRLRIPTLGTATHRQSIAAFGLFSRVPPRIPAGDALVGSGRLHGQFVRRQRLQGLVTALGKELQAVIPGAFVEAPPAANRQASGRVVGHGLEFLFRLLNSLALANCLLNVPDAFGHSRLCGLGGVEIVFRLRGFPLAIRDFRRIARAGDRCPRSKISPLCSPHRFGQRLRAASSRSRASSAASWAAAASANRMQASHAPESCSPRTPAPARV